MQALRDLRSDGAVVQRAPVAQHGTCRRSLNLERSRDQGPHARPVRGNDHVDPLAHTQRHRVDHDRSDWAAVGMSDLEPVAGDRDSKGRCAAAVDEAQPEALAVSDAKVRGRGRQLAIDQKALIGRRTPAHTHAAGKRLWRARQVVVEKDRVFAVPGDMWRCLLDDQRAGETAVELQSEVAVVEVAAGRCRRELVDEGVARLDRVLRHAGNAIHSVGHRYAMPVDRGRLRQLIVEHDLHGLAFADANLRRRVGAVEEPGVIGRSAPNVDLPCRGRASELAELADRGGLGRVSWDLNWRVGREGSKRASANGPQGDEPPAQ